MLTLNDGRSELWQWDTGRTLSVPADCSQVHFSNKVFGRSVDVDVVDGAANIPDILLQTDKELTAWAFVGTAENGYTKISKVFKVNKRNKPADYVFTPTDQTTLEDILDRIEDLEKRPSGGNGGITKEVDPTVPDWAKQPQKPTYTAAEVGALPDTTKIPSTAEDVGALPANSFIPKTAADVGAIPAPETATVGQTIVVKEVDDSGKPVSWECMDMAACGEKWELINEVNVTEECGPIVLTSDSSGNAFNLKKLYIAAKCNGIESATSAALLILNLSEMPFDAGGKITQVNGAIGKHNAPARCGMYVERVANTFYSISSNSSTSYDSTPISSSASMNALSPGYSFNGITDINALCFWSNSYWSGATFGVGTIIKVYGVRA